MSLHPIMYFHPYSSVFIHTFPSIHLHSSNSIHVSSSFNPHPLISIHLYPFIRIHPSSPTIHILPFILYHSIHLRPFNHTHPFPSNHLNSFIFAGCSSSYLTCFLYSYKEPVYLLHGFTFVFTYISSKNCSIKT